MADMQSQSAPEQAKEKVQEAAQTAQHQARSRVSEQVDQRSTQIGEQAGTAAQALRQSSDHLREQGNDGVARYIEQAAEKIESTGNWLRQADGDTLLNDVEGFGRRNPWVVMAGGIAAGFAASRVLKASAERRQGLYGPTYSGASTRVGNGYTTPGYTTPGYGGGTGYERVPSSTPTGTPPVTPPATPAAPTLPGATSTTTFGDRS